MAHPKNNAHSLSAPLASTLALLRQPKFQASVAVLAKGLASKHSAIRLASLQALLDRGGEADFAAILAHIDQGSATELETLRPHVGRMLEAVDHGLVSRDPEIRQRALWVIGKFELQSHFRFLIDAICDPKDPQQMVAMELVSHLARSLGHDARTEASVESEHREQLLIALQLGIESYANHRVQQMLDWWAAAAHWNDSLVAKLFADRSTDEAAARLIENMERSKNKETIELVTGLLWSRDANDSMLQCVARRIDPPFIETLSRFFRSFGVTRELKRNLGQPIDWKFLNRETFDDHRISLSAKCCLVELLTLLSAPSEELMARIACLVEQLDSSSELQGAELQVTELIEHQRPINTDLAVIALSDALDAPDIESSVPPPWKQSLRHALEVLITAHSSRNVRLQAAISNLFREFKCETLLEKLLDWPNGHLLAYARLTRIAQPDFIDQLMVELQSQTPQRRQRGVQASRMFGLDQALWELVANKLEDPVDDVRIEAIRALADSEDRQNAIALITPLIAESNPAIQQAASLSLENLGGWR